MTGWRADRPAARSSPGEAALALVRIALLIGVVAFGGIAWLIHRQPGWLPATAGERGWRVLLTATWAVAVLGVIALRAALARAADARRRTLLIAAWALGDAVALAGGLHYFMTGEPRWYIAGLLFMLGTFIAFPVRRPS